GFSFFCLILFYCCHSLTEDDENKERGNWSSKTDYILSTIGYAVGLGNIWRFPYLAYKNGGGAFLIPYFLMLLLAGLPLFFMESALGQFCSQGPINVWRAVPLLQGVGVAMVLITLIVSFYYNVIIAYSLYYMFASFQYPLPWARCSDSGADNCTDPYTVLCNVSGVVISNWTQQNMSCPLPDQIQVQSQTPSEEYWDTVALRRSSGMDQTGTVVWHLALCLLLSSIIVGAVLIRGIKSSGKVVYFTATFPYVVIFILLIRGVTLEGVRDGIEYYIGTQSNLTKLLEAEVWKDAATQTFFSLSVGWGGVMTLASYNNFNNNMFKDSFIVCFTNAGTSVFAGFAIFSILGHMSFVYNKPVGEVVKEGFGLAFIAYPDALSQLPISPLWSVLFFFMLLTVGLDSQFAGIGILSVAGIYWVTLLDTFLGTWVLLIVGLLEVVGITYIYGGNRFVKDIEMMIGDKTFCFWLWWRACWFFISPCIIMVILVWSLMTFTPPSYGTVPYPGWAIALGWCISVFVLMWIPVIALYKFIKAPGSPWERLKSLCRPTEDWHPYLEKHRGERYSVENQPDKVDTNSICVISSSWL
uniref:Transporter n=1 Tax=Neogobius melanostomus TaxID=47308 RepID=A0A8C6SZ12_9GOBI